MSGTWDSDSNSWDSDGDAWNTKYGQVAVISASSFAAIGHKVYLGVAAIASATVVTFAGIRRRTAACVVTSTALFTSAGHLFWEHESTKTGVWTSESEYTG